MKKRYLMLAGILVVSVAAAGCGKKNDSSADTVQAVQATATPAVTEAAQNNVVEMQKTEDDTSNIKNVMGTKSDTTTSIVINNSMGSEISSIYVRATRDDGDDSEETWGSDLVNGRFRLADNDKALYYMEKSQKDDQGNAASSFDIRITFSDEEQNECFFRQIPLTTVSEITLCMDGSGEDGIPYAKYKTGSSSTEVSTLNDVKNRLGLTDDSESNDESVQDATPTPDPESSDSTSTDNTDNTDSTNAQPTQEADPTESPEPTETPDPGENPDPTETPDTPETPDDPDPTEAPSEDDPSSTAQQYIGQSLDSLVSACGSPNGSDYEDEPESGKTGYHYYDTFTVSTTVDENGNEVVSGVW